MRYVIVAVLSALAFLLGAIIAYVVLGPSQPYWLFALVGGAFGLRAMGGLANSFGDQSARWSFQLSVMVIAGAVWGLTHLSVK